ncbi:relaxase domain-containing protein [Geothermobacter hydrogeniphilus]|uniref:TrwC relaxase domain-containing protein n=1 Tax=Geothermobacter hydrogeniphilus TaxID=1969733 RepID=A0A1X0Y823_9BACT|nr:hypothetical protein B5V00_06935 [Geothermobacter hydrogeniphilus]
MRFCSFVGTPGRLVPPAWPGDIYYPTEGILCLSINHSLNREKEPDLHSHALIANLGKIHGKDRLRSVDLRQIYKNKRIKSISIRSINTKVIPWFCRGQSEIDSSRSHLKSPPPSVNRSKFFVPSHGTNLPRTSKRPESYSSIRIA